METLRQDLHFALRTLRRRPGFSLVAVITLALGIGANSAIFSVVNGVLLRSLPFGDPDRLVMLYTAYPGEDVTYPLSAPDFMSVHDEGRVFTDVAAVATTEQTLTGDGEPLRLSVGVVSADFFELLGVSPLVGRGFRAEENDPGIQRGGGPRPRRLAAAVRRRPRGDRPPRHPQRRAAHRGGGAPAGVRLPRRARRLLSPRLRLHLQLHHRRGPSRRVPGRLRAAPPRCLSRAGHGRRAGALRSAPARVPADELEPDHRHGPAEGPAPRRDPDAAARAPGGGGAGAADRLRQRGEPPPRPRRGARGRARRAQCAGRRPRAARPAAPHRERGAGAARGRRGAPPRLRRDARAGRHPSRGHPAPGGDRPRLHGGGLHRARRGGHRAALRADPRAPGHPRRAGRPAARGRAQRTPRERRAAACGAAWWWARWRWQ